ncbi:hypothetical protein [Streptomyces sp. TRM68367]|nr:hypothetical protein [Streptomyces sp. TRM68367]
MGLHGRLGHGGAAAGLGVGQVLGEGAQDLSPAAGERGEAVAGGA